MAATTEAQTADLMISPEEARRKLASGDPVLVLDVRSPSDWQSCRLKMQGAIRVPPDSFAIDAAWLKDRFTLVYCSCPHDEASIRIARQLRGQGFNNVHVLQGGFHAWRALAMPVEPEEVDMEDPRAPAEIVCPEPGKLRGTH